MTQAKLEHMHELAYVLVHLGTSWYALVRIGTSWYVLFVKILVHAQDSCACTTLLCMHNTLVHALEGPGTKAGTQTKSAAGPVWCGAFFWVPALVPGPSSAWLLYTSDAVDDLPRVDPGGRRTTEINILTSYHIFLSSHV